MSESHRFLCKSVLALSVALGGTQGIAYAQQQPEQDQTPEAAPEAAPEPQGPKEEPVSPPPPPPVPQPEPEADTGTILEEEVDLSDLSEAATEIDVGAAMEGEVIVITGSAIERRDLTTPAPVAIMDKTEIDAAGIASIGDVLQDLPSQSNAINTQINNGGTGSTRISLRGLGAGRTLVLVNGRRHVPGGTGANSSVDLNAIPMAVIERVEVLKDGASAIYGSDAIGGVVNIITRRDFEGTEATVYTGTSSRGDGTVYDLNVTGGTSSDRSNIVFSAGYYQQDPVYAGNRDFSKFDYRWNWKLGEEYTYGSDAVPEGHIIAEDAAGVVCPSGNCIRGEDGTWRDFVYPQSAADGLGDYYNYAPENYLLTPQQRYNIFSTGNYELHPNVTGFFEASYTNRQSDQLLAPEPLFTISEGLVVSRDNAYNPFGLDFRDIRRRLVEFDNRRSFQDVDTFRIITGLEGRLPEALPALSRWRWNVAYNYGRTESANIKEGNIIRSRLDSAVGPSFRDEEGNLRCGTREDPGDPACVPLNLFGGPGSISKEMRDYLTYTGIAKGLNEQSSLSADTSGKLFDTPWGGDVALAMGASYRSEYGADIPDPRTAVGDTTGNKSEPTQGGYDVAEGYGELSVVPVVGRPGMDWLELSAAARVFRYSTFGSDYTWKAGGLWRILKGLSVRGTYSTAFRAPSIGELYTGKADSFPGVSDPCDTSQEALSPEEQRLCAAAGVPEKFTDQREQLRTRVGGNEDLEPEVADIFTVGTVYEPHFLPGAALTVDYFHIDLTNAIQTIGARTILNNCYSKGDPTACALITRDAATHLITDIENTLTNIGGVKTAGVDINLRYQTTSPRAGRLLFDLEGTWLQKVNERLPNGDLIRGKGVYDLGLFPDWRFNFSTLWNLAPWGAGLNVQFINGFKECEDDACYLPEKGSLDVSPYAKADLHGSYTLQTAAGTSRFTLGVNNVLDTEPPRIYAGGSADYDFLGRFFYMRFVQTF